MILRFARIWCISPQSCTELHRGKAQSCWLIEFVTIFKKIHNQLCAFPLWYSVQLCGEMRQMRKQREPQNSTFHPQKPVFRRLSPSRPG